MRLAEAVQRGHRAWLLAETLFDAGYQVRIKMVRRNKVRNKADARVCQCCCMCRQSAQFWERFLASRKTSVLFTCVIQTKLSYRLQVCLQRQSPRTGCVEQSQSRSNYRRTKAHSRNLVAALKQQNDMGSKSWHVTSNLRVSRACSKMRILA